MGVKHNETYTSGKPYLVDGQTLNNYSAGLNMLRSSSGSYDNAFQGGTFQQTLTPPPFICGVAVIISTDGDCDQGDNPRDGYEAPCEDENLYLCRFRWFDHTRQAWQESTENVRLDAGDYWEGVVADDGELVNVNRVDNPFMKVDENQTVDQNFETKASQSPATGPSFGAIPVYKVGDVVPAFWDEQRGWAVAIQSPPQDVPRGAFVSSEEQTIEQASSGDTDTVSVYLERRTPDPRGGYPSPWEALGELHFAVPYAMPDEWKETRSGFAYFSATQGVDDPTMVRLRIVNHSSYDVTCTRSVISLFGAGRMTEGNISNDSTIEALQGGDTREGWEVETLIQGRFRDSPVFQTGTLVKKSDADEAAEGPAPNDHVSVRYDDPLDKWIIGCEFVVTLTPQPDSGFSSSSTSSRSSSSSEMSMSESSLSSSSYSASSQSTSSSSGTCEYVDKYNETYTCVNVVSSIGCNVDGTVSEVCYITLCFPLIPGFSATPGGKCSAVSRELCMPCADLSSDSSSEHTSSSSALCADYDLDTPKSATTASATASVNVDLLDGGNAIWADVADDGNLWIVLEANSGFGYVTIKTTGTGANIHETGVINYEPGPGDEPGDVITLVFTVCDQTNNCCATSVVNITIGQEFEDCIQYKLDTDPHFDSPPSSYHDERPVTAALIVPVGDPSEDHWQEAIDNHSVTAQLLSTNGSGTWKYNEEDGTVTYTPPADGSENGLNIISYWNVCDIPDTGETSSSSSITSSTSLLSESSTSTVSALSTSSSQSSMSSSASSSSSSSHSSSSSSSPSSSSSSSSSSPSSPSSSSSSSSSTSSQEDCDAFFVYSPIYESTTTSTAPLLIDLLPTTGAWTDSIANHTTTVTVTGNTGAGTVNVEQDFGYDNGFITYNPPGDGSEAGQTIAITVRVCDTVSGCCIDLTVYVYVSEVA